MADEDAEWIPTLDRGPPTRRPPIRPPTRRPPIRPILPPTIPDDEFETPPPETPPHDASETESPSSQTSSAVIISASVASSVTLVVLIILLLYLFVLKKKLKKANKSKSESEFCIRVEDVSHLDINDTANMYVNTTDLQKLVSSVRIKNKKPLPPKFQNDPPEIVRINKPQINGEIIYDVPVEEAPIDVSNERIKMELINNLTKKTRPQIPPPNASQIQTISQSREDLSAYPILRKAPAPPITGTISYSVPPASSRLSDDCYSEVTPEDKLDPISKLRSCLDESKPPPPVLPKPLISKGSEIPSRSVPPVFNHTPPKTIKNPPPTMPKPNSKENQNKSILPRLKMSPFPSVIRQDSGFSTPDTGVSYISESDGTPNSSYEPETMSVTAKRALLEGIMANEGKKSHY